MAGFAATDVAIRVAQETGTLRAEPQTGRFGPYWTISDECGLIEVAMTADEVKTRTGLNV